MTEQPLQKSSAESDEVERLTLLQESPQNPSAWAQTGSVVSTDQFTGTWNY